MLLWFFLPSIVLSPGSFLLHHRTLPIAAYWSTCPLEQTFQPATACFPCRAAERQRAARRKKAALEDGIFAIISPLIGLIQLKWLCSELVGTGEISWQEWGRTQGILGRAAEAKGAWFSRCQILFAKHTMLWQTSARSNRGSEDVSSSCQEHIV